MSCVAVWECPKCGAWRDVMFDDLTPEGSACQAGFWCCNCDSPEPGSPDAGLAFHLPPVDFRYYELQLAGLPAAADARYTVANVRPLLEPLLDA